MSAGCVSSLNPLYFETDTVFDRSIIGVWTDNEQTETWTFTHSGGKEYKLVYIDEGGKSGRFNAHLFSIDDKLFLDITPAKPRISENDFYKSHFAAMHTFVRVVKTDGSFQISYLEPDWLKTHLQKNPSAIAHVPVDGTIVLTDSTKNLRSFVVANIDTPGAFSEPIAIRHKR